MLKGSCLCGAVHYEVAGMSGKIGHCHCMTCQKAHAAAYATTGRVKRADFRWTRGEDKLNFFEATPGKRRYFCGGCGSHLVAGWDHEDEWILRVATLDNDPGETPAANIWVSHDRPWLANKHLPKFEEWPGR